MVGLTINTLRRESQNSVHTAWVPITHIPGAPSDSLTQMDGTEEREREVFEVEVTWTNGIITPQNHL